MKMQGFLYFTNILRQFPAFGQLKKCSPDVITLDIYLPDANGLSILKELRADPKTDKIPVIIISSSDEMRNPEDAGAQDIVKKTIDFRKLFMVIRSISS